MKDLLALTEVLPVGDCESEIFLRCFALLDVKNSIEINSTQSLSQSQSLSDNDP